MIATHFVYAPRTGAKWLAGAGPRPDARVPCVTWPNRSAHVVGHLLRVWTAEPGSWWRDAAGEVARAFARSWGGVAWDDCGKVSLVLPPSSSGVHLVVALRALWIVRAAYTGIRPSADALRILDASIDDDEVVAAQLRGPYWTAVTLAHALDPAWVEPIITPHPRGWTVQYWTQEYEIRVPVEWLPGEAAWTPSVIVAT